MAFRATSLRGEEADFFSPRVFSEAVKASCAAYSQGFVMKEVTNDLICIAFSGSHLDGSAFSQTTTQYGVCEINSNNDYFGSMKDGSAKKQPPQPALVHQGALNQFIDIYKSFNLQQKVAKAIEEGKTILFTGHNIGGAIATLATLSILEKQGKSGSVFCITFGFPLIGDEVLARAVRRQGWANHFCHVVSRGDIFARILLAPCVSISVPLEALLPFWQRSMQQKGDHTTHSSTDISMEEACPANLDIFRTVLRHASAVVNYTSATNMAPTNKMIADLKNVVNLSPYRPFGCYVFCSDSGAIWVENYEAVLPILYYTLAAAPHDESSISEHTGYDKVVTNVITNKVKLEELSKLALSQAAAASLEKRNIETQLDALGLGIQNIRARIALRAAGEVEDRLKKNMKKLEEERNNLELSVKPKKEHPMTILKLYRTICLEVYKTGYYVSFKDHQNRIDDFDANISRLKLAGFYDKVEDMVDNHQLPDDFQCSEEWIREVTEYRLLVEPLDICNYYRLGKDQDAGHYLARRPRRYKAFEKWLADKEGNNGKDSCFWAYVEEIACTRNNQFQMRVRAMIESNEVPAEEVLNEQSSLVKWWKKLNPQERESSPLLSVLKDKF